MPLHIENTVTATFKITTPMFIGDANKHAECIRPASIKGALRFWWRALNWNTHLYNANNDINAALKSLHKEEAVLFGAAAEEGSESKTTQGGQGLFLLQVHQGKIVPQSTPFGENINNAHKYLLGIGLVKYDENEERDRLTRDAIASGEFSVQLLFKKDIHTDQRKSILDSLYAFGLLGALGSRARHGMGSVSISKWEGLLEKEKLDYGLAKTWDQYKCSMTLLLGKYIQGGLTDIVEPPITAFSRNARIYFSAGDKDAFELLSKVGDIQLKHRSFGKNDKIKLSNERIVKANKNYKEDHDLFVNENGNIDICQVNKCPQRVVFGLPHNYFFSSASPKRKIFVNYTEGTDEKRRASPLLLHIHYLPLENRFVAVHVFLPGMFLPNGAEITIREKNQRKPVSAPTTDKWKPIHDYLNEFTEGKEINYGN